MITALLTIMKTPTFLVVFGIALLLSSCATPNFHKEWDKAVAEAKTPYKTIAGPWDGQWVSGHNNHTGELKCIVTPVDENHYRFHYFARWAGFMKGTFIIQCEAEKKANGYYVTGAKKLVPFGTYQHRGTLTAASFDATFGSEGKDFGTFVMKRPEKE